MKRVFLIIIFATLLVQCRSYQGAYHIKQAISEGSKVAVLIEGNNEMKNAVFLEFMNAGYDVKAVNAADFYTTDDVYDIKTLKTKTLSTDADDEDAAKRDAAFADKAFNNIYKLHLYNFENFKAEALDDMRKNWGSDYLILLSMTRWDEGYSWARAIDLRNKNLIYVHNYTTGKSDTYQTITRNMIEVLKNGK